MFFSLGAWLQQSLRSKSHVSPRRRPVDRVLSLEHLEARVVPAATLFVNQAGTGGAFTTIQAAVNAAAAGDTIQVAAGLYQEHVVVNKSLTLLGAEAATLAYGSRTNGESVVDGTLTGTTFTFSANNVVLSGFDIIHGASSSGGFGISITGNIVGGRIANNIIDDNELGIYLNGTGIVVQGNLIENNNEFLGVGPAAGNGIYSDQGSANLTIADNQFQNDQNGALTFAQLTTAPASNPSDPLHNVNLLVTRNAFFDVNMGGFADLTNGVISFNTVHATADYSNIAVAGGVNGLRILDNVLSGGSRGVYVLGAANAFDPVPSKGVVISVSNQFSGHSTGTALTIEAGAESDVVDATRNFWNSSTGPTFAGNPAGTGEGIVAPDGNVTFAPFNVTPHNAPSHAGAFVGLTSQEHFVQALYMDVLGRQGSKGELDGWVSVLNGSGGAAVAAGIENSAEGRDVVVRSFYRNYLGRQAQNGEEMGWVNLLQQGQTEETVISQIVASSEFYARAQTLVASGTPDERYVQALYRLLLGRNGSASEVATQVNALSMSGRQQVALGFLGSYEFRLSQFEEYYNTLLHRQADSQGVNTWIFSNMDIHSVRIGIETAPEFFNNG